jgi:hypothetical protein
MADENVNIADEQPKFLETVLDTAEYLLQNDANSEVAE